jgi:hypothetical protein
VPGAAAGAGGAATLGYDARAALGPLTVDFHEPGFLEGLNAENAFTAEKGFPFQLNGEARQQAKANSGPDNPQALNRYAYVLNNPVRYTDPDGHCGPVCIRLLESLGNLIQRYGPGAAVWVTGMINRLTWAPRAVTRADGLRLDTNRINTVGAGNSALDKLDYLMGKVASKTSEGKGGFFVGQMGHTRETLDAALRVHLIENFDKSVTNALGNIEVRGLMSGPNGFIARVLSVWQVLADGTIRLITAHPD